MLRNEKELEAVYLKPMQIKCIKAAAKGDVLALLPTGYGKSVVYDILPYYMKANHFSDNVSKIVIVCPLNIILDEIKKRHPHTAVCVADLCVKTTESKSIDFDDDEDLESCREKQSFDEFVPNRTS